MTAPQLAPPVGAVEAFRLGLLGWLRGGPSPVQMALVEEACQLRRRMLTSDQRFLAAAGRSEAEERAYQADAGRLLRAMALLGASAALPGADAGLAAGAALAAPAAAPQTRLGPEGTA